eukprot:1676581-Lingulodinium_polyedra.AAC.1
MSELAKRDAQATLDQQTGRGGREDVTFRERKGGTRQGRRVPSTQRCPRARPQNVGLRGARLGDTQNA